MDEFDKERFKSAKKVVKTLAGTSLSDIQLRLANSVDKRLADAIERSLSDIDHAVRGAMLRSIGIKERYGEYEFSEPNGVKSPARIVADNKMLKLVERNADQWVQAAFDQSIEGMKVAAKKHFDREFERYLKVALSRLAEKEANDICSLVLHEIKSKVDNIISEVIQPQQFVPVCKDGEPDLIDAEAFASAAGIKALATLAEDL